MDFQDILYSCIDGFSGYIVFLRCATNNETETVLSIFENTILCSGVSCRIRTNKGGENILLLQEMLELRGPNSGSYLAGSSVHNQRIERFWRDVWSSVYCDFYYT